MAVNETAAPWHQFMSIPTCKKAEIKSQSQA